MSDYGISGRDANCSLPELVKLLRKSSEAVTRFQGGDPYYIEEVAIFKEPARDQGYLLQQAPAELDTPCHDSGNEHEVWFIGDAHRYLKATWPNHFGMKVVYLPHQEPKASPIDYLERWQLHNEVFGDSVQFVGALESPEGMRLIINQPAIERQPATVEQINTFFLGKDRGQ